MIRDKLLVVGVIVNDKVLLHIAITGLLKDYNGFRSAIKTRSTQLIALMSLIQCAMQKKSP